MKKSIITILILISIIPRIYSQLSIGSRNCGIGLGYIFTEKRDSVYNGIHFNIINYVNSNYTLNGLDINLISVLKGHANQRYTTNGVSIDLFNVGDQEVNGLQISLIDSRIMNRSITKVSGFSLNVIKLGGQVTNGFSLSGIQITKMGVGGSYITKGVSCALIHADAANINGLCIGGINYVFQIKGCSLGGINISRLVTGIQIGLINFNYGKEERGMQIGLINYKRNGRLLKIMPLINFW